MKPFKKSDNFYASSQDAIIKALETISSQLAEMTDLFGEKVEVFHCKICKGEVSIVGLSKGGKVMGQCVACKKWHILRGVV